VVSITIYLIITFSIFWITKWQFLQQDKNQSIQQHRDRLSAIFNMLIMNSVALSNSFDLTKYPFRFYFQHKLCCQPQSTLFRPVPGCKDNELPLSFSGSDHLCGLCQCKKECEMHEAFLDHNTCGVNRDMCCKLCACKRECDSFDIDIGQGLCGYHLQQCCRACVCKTPCNKPEELLGPEGCFYGETVCCVTWKMSWCMLMLWLRSVSDTFRMILIEILIDYFCINEYKIEHSYDKM
jgi:hypothetical protein